MKTSTLSQDLVLLVLAVALAAASVTLVWVRHESRWQFRELQKLAAQDRELRLKRDDLQLIHAALRNGEAVEHMARGELGLVYPAVSQHEVIAP